MGETIMKRGVLYLRVSTIEQTTANQERELRQAAERAGWEVTKVYRDHAISGATSRDQRPAFDAALPRCDQASVRCRDGLER
jgi:DNA invertase Pin-like site-specific DNA recombinase